MKGFSGFLKKQKEGAGKKKSRDFAKRFRQGFNKQTSKEDRQKRENAYAERLRKQSN